MQQEATNIFINAESTNIYILHDQNMNRNFPAKQKYFIDRYVHLIERMSFYSGKKNHLYNYKKKEKNYS